MKRHNQWLVWQEQMLHGSAPKASRPSRGPTQFPGSAVFAAERGVSHSHLYRVLTGERQSASLVAAFNAWLKKHGQPWPAAAAVKPTTHRAA